MNSSVKFNLNYTLVIEDINGNLHTIQSWENVKNKDNNKYKNVDVLNSLTVRINIDKTNTTAGNKCKVEILNLSISTRKLLKKSRLDENIDRKLEVYAGYQNNLTLLFKGTIETASSYRQGTEYITVINGRDGQFSMINSNTNQAITKDYKDNPLILLANDLKNIQQGYITKMTPINIGSRGRSFNGKTWDILSNINDVEVFINNEKIYIMKANEVLINNILLLNNDTGIMNEPQEFDGYLEVESLFEPNAEINNLVQLNSELAREYNGEYKLLGVNHKLEISKIGKSSEGITTMKLTFGKEQFDKVKGK